jgi:hypothetical protein
MKVLIHFLVFFSILGCPGDIKDKDPITLLCAGEGSTSVQLGTGAGSEFSPIEDGSKVGLDVAPQGGFGVSVRAKTTGLVADDSVSVLLEPYIDGESAGSFLNEAVQLYCQDDGGGLLWGVVVGFDPDTFPTNDDLLALNGELVELVVTITDSSGEVGTGSVTVEIEVGG